jgi:hypothetical protein
MTDRPIAEADLHGLRIIDEQLSAEHAAKVESYLAINREDAARLSG